MMGGRSGIFIAGVMLLIAGFVAWRTLTRRSAAEDVAIQNFICAETNLPFQYEIKDGDHFPVISPHTNRPTGYPAEKCFWTADGKAKLKPTYVLLKSELGQEGQTFCPDCGREVFPHNPLPPAELMRAAREAAEK